MIPAILGALGQAAGGASGAASALGASEIAAQAASVSRLTSSTQQAITGFERLTPTMQKLVGVVTAAPAKILELQQVITGTSDVFVRALAAPIDTIKMLSDSISRFVRFASPATVQMFEFRFENLMASFGRSFAPILNALGRAADRTNEAFAKLAPTLDTLTAAGVEVIDTVANGLVPAFRELAPAIQLATGQLAPLTAYFKFHAQSMQGLADLARTLNPFIGLLGGFNEDAQKAVAARPPRLTSAEEIQRDAAKRSIEASFAAMSGQKKPETTESFLDQILKFLVNNLSLEKLKELVTHIGEVILGALPKVPSMPNLPNLPSLPSIPNPLDLLPSLREG